MIKKLFICGLMSLLFISASAQTPSPNDPIKVNFVAYWNKGDVYRFKITKVKKKWKNGKITQNTQDHYIARFEVIDSTSKSYKIKWQFEEAYFANRFNPTPELREKFKKYDSLAIIYSTDELGAFQGIDNWQEIAQLAKELTTEMTKQATANMSGTEQAKFKQAMIPILQMYSSKEAIEQLVFKEIAYIHSPFGAEYNTADSVKYEDQLPNFFGGKPIKVDASIHFTKVDTTEGRCTMIQQLKLNPDDSKRMIKELFRKMGLMDHDTKKGLQEAMIDIKDYTQMDYYYYPGVPVRMKARRDVLIYLMGQKGRRRDIVKIELITD